MDPKWKQEGVEMQENTGEKRRGNNAENIMKTDSWGPNRGADCATMLGGPWAQYIRSGPEGAQGVFGCAALSLSFSFSFDSFFSIFDLIVSLGATRASWH